MNTRTAVTILAALALAIAGAAQASGPKTLGGVFLGQTRASVEYHLGLGHQLSDRRTQYGKLSVFYTAGRYAGGGRVASIETRRTGDSYDHVRVGGRVPLGRCVRAEGNRCAHRWRWLWYDVGNRVWAGKRGRVFVLVALGSDSRVASISISTCRPCRGTPNGVVLD